MMFTPLSLIERWRGARARLATGASDYCETTVADSITVGFCGTSCIGPRVVVGLPSIFFTTSMPLVTLPNTKVQVRVPLVTYYMAVSGYPAAAHGVMPDYSINHTVEDFIAGRDQDMDTALQLARKATP